MVASAAIAKRPLLLLASAWPYASTTASFPLHFIFKGFYHQAAFRARKQHLISLIAFIHASHYAYMGHLKCIMPLSSFQYEYTPLSKFQGETYVGYFQPLLALASYRTQTKHYDALIIVARFYFSRTDKKYEPR